MIKNIYFVSHCVLNTCSKVLHEDSLDYQKEEDSRLNFLEKIQSQDVQIIQLPCPEFLMYGAKRWGHSKSQFDNPFFKEQCKAMLNPYVLSMVEYLKYPDRFCIKAIVGINGSPSCGIDFSFDGPDFGGEFSGGIPINDRLKSGYLSQSSGVFMEVLKDLLKEHSLHIPLVSLENV